MSDRKFVELHNTTLVVNQSDPKTERFLEIISFLLRSRISFALQHGPRVYLSIVQEFWRNIGYDGSTDPPSIQTVIQGNRVKFTAEDLRVILHLGTVEENSGPTEFPVEFRRSALLRMGYSVPFTRRVIKAALLGQWRYFSIIIVQCLSTRKGGYEQLNSREQSIMAGLVYNKPLNLAKLFFEDFVEQITAPTGKKFLLFPRFVELIARFFIPDLNLGTQQSVVKTIGMGRIFADCYSNRPNVPPQDIPKETPMFGHIINPTYRMDDDLGLSSAQQSTEDSTAAVDQQEADFCSSLQLALQTDPPQLQQRILDDICGALDNPQGAEIVDTVVEHLTQEILEQRAIVPDALYDVDDYAVPQSEDLHLFPDGEPIPLNIEGICNDEVRDANDEAPPAPKSEQVVMTQRVRKRKVVEKTEPVEEETFDYLLKRTKTHSFVEVLMSGSTGNSSGSLSSSSTTNALAVSAQESNVQTVAQTVLEMKPSTSALVLMDDSLPSSVTEPVVSISAPKESIVVTTTPLGLPSFGYTTTPTIRTSLPSKTSSMPNFLLPSEIRLQELENKTSIRDADVLGLKLRVEELERKLVVERRDHELQIAQLHDHIRRMNEQRQQDLADFANSLDNRILSQVQGLMQRRVQDMVNLGEIRAPSLTTSSTSQDGALNLVRRNDKEPEDPATRENQPRSLTTDLDVANVQGESAIQGESAQEEDNSAKEVIQALFGLDEDLEDDWVSETDDVPGSSTANYYQEKEIPNNETARNSDKEIEHIYRVADEVIFEEDGFTSKIDDNAGRLIQELTKVQVDTEISATGSGKVDKSKERSSWFRELPPKPKPVKYLDWLDLSSKGIYASGKSKQKIINWYYDDELKKIVIKRFTEVQYFAPNFKSLSTLPLIELRVIAQLDLINKSGNKLANSIAAIVKREVLSGKFDLLKPTNTGKVYTSKSKVDPKTKLPISRISYKPAKVVDKVPLKKLPQNILGNFKQWAIDRFTGEAIFKDKEDKEVLVLYDPFHLVNLSKNDLAILKGVKMIRAAIWDVDAKMFEEIVDLCNEHGLHADWETD